MKKKYFGTDGIRGEVGHSIITPDFILKLGNAAGRVLVNHNQRQEPTIIIGKDTRISGYMLEAALQAGLTSAGVRVLLTGPLPTPGISYLTKALRLNAGVMLSASHNVYSDNGIKFFTEDGLKLSDELELEIEKALDEPMSYVSPDKFGRAKRIDGAVDRYIEFCKSTFPSNFDLYNLKIVVDTANGAGYHVAPKVFHELGAQVVSIGDSPNGFNINDKVGATHVKTLQVAVLENKADYGVAIDGDGDRLIMVDKYGSIYDGDSLIYIIAKARKCANTLQGGVVGTVMTNMAMEQALNEMSIEFERSQVGDRYVLEKLLEKKWQVGGEASGHILCLDKHITGDGIISALQVFSSLKILDQNLDSIRNDWIPYPQIMKNVKIDSSSNWQEKSREAIEKAEKKLEGGVGRVVVRASGTEPVVRVMVEARKSDQAEKLAQSIADAMTA
ncbi:phosphoglucosamine mutase [Neisseriaceae bacterium PsAf]|nr:phosphoglucosamine mutase [Neisseriaceae bacterium PsAf]